MKLPDTIASAPKSKIKSKSMIKIKDTLREPIPPRSWL
jgi:hypothetical protein